MAKEKLSQYGGRLTPAQIADGMNAAVRNARRLANDARTLLDLERYPTAASIAVLPIEESGKVSILRHFAMARDLPSCRKIWREYRNHRSKNAAWILPDLVAGGACDPRFPSTCNAVRCGTHRSLGNHEGSSAELVLCDERSRSVEGGRHECEGICHGDRLGTGAPI